MHTPGDEKNAALSAALRVADDAWEELKRTPYVQQRLGITPVGLLDVSLAEAERRSRVGGTLLKRIDSIDLDTLPHDLALTLRLVRFRARTWSEEAKWYWTALDPRGIGQFGLFLPTAYCGGALLNVVHSQLASFSFLQSGDTHRYLALVADYARLIDSFTARTAGQAQQGIRMPKVQVLQARALLARFKSSVRTALSVAPERLTALSAGNFARELDGLITTVVLPAFERALAGLSDAYLEQAPEMVGLGQYPRGTELYAELVKLHTTLDLTPEQVHSRGLERMAETEGAITAVQSELGFDGDLHGFITYLNSNPEWRANTIEGVTAVFQRYIERLKPHLDDAFSTMPKASYGVAPLSEALQGSMTYGYYDPPRADRAEGFYAFNGANLTRQPLFHIGALTYHELMPGHHLQFATQQEKVTLHPFRAHSFVNAYVEGWAEYAATFVGELGMYQRPEERYGRLVMDAFLTSRLVVDTGMNTLGWSLERAREYMRAHSRLVEAEVLTETVRYSCDIPGQALAYKLGDTHLLGMRERMRQALGKHFDLKHFHAAVLEPGALPLGDLEWHVEHEVEELKCDVSARTGKAL
jgi:uncharacterized protein (DUF885 family)